jgi:Beta-lactamase enzyme family
MRKSRWIARRPVVVAVAIGFGLVPILVGASPGADAASLVRGHAGSAQISAPVNLACQASITACALGVLSPAGGTEGVYLKQVGGAVLASNNASYAFEPASSIKPVIALYALTQVEQGALHLTTQIPEIDGSGGRGDCPPATIIGTEALGTALQQMLQVSDNNRTRELMQYFGVGTLNSFASSLGLTSTHFQTSAKAPGFNLIGCNNYPGNGLPTTMDGNTTSLADLASLWTKIAALPAPYANAFFQFAAGRAMVNTVGGDSSGIWPDLVNLVHAVAPTSLTSAQVQSYIDHMDLSAKIGEYRWNICMTAQICERSWAILGFTTLLPSCSRTHKVQETEYVGGDFVSSSDEAYAVNNPVAYTVVAPAVEQMLERQVAGGLANWSSCAPAALPQLSGSGISSRAPLTIGIGTTLATFKDTDLSEITGDLVGVVNWRDGPNNGADFSSLIVSGRQGVFTVHGWHQFTKPGIHTIVLSLKSVAANASYSVSTTLLT